MKSFSFARALLATSMLCLAVPLACGDSEENPDKPAPNPNVGGEGGATGEGGSGAAMGLAGAPMLPPGISDMPSTIECSTSCDSARVGLGTQSFYLDPCCTDADEACGINTAFLASVGAAFEQVCQPKDQPGEEDANCPSPPAASIPVMGVMAMLDEFPGCCRPNGVCGVAVNAVTLMGLPLGDLELGCVDAAPFFPGEDPVPCGEGVGGAGGSGAGGAPMVTGGNGAGGASGGAGGAGGGQ